MAVIQRNMFGSLSYPFSEAIINKILNEKGEEYLAYKNHTHEKSEITDFPTTVPVGAVVPFAGNSPQEGWLLCDGSAVSRSDYADLFKVIGVTYGAGDGNTTFNLPNLISKFVEGSSFAGAEKEAGLPNITGTFGNCEEESSYFDGAFSPYGTSGGANYHDKGGFNVTFDASRSSAVYGKSNTVQPPALTMRYIIKY